MFGHKKSQGYKDNIFRVISKTLTDEESVAADFVIYCSRYPVLLRLYNVFGGAGLFKFLNLFGGSDMVVTCDENDDLKYTFLPEILDIFGPEVMEEFVTEFGGTKVKIPSIDKIISSVRDIDIYHVVDDKRQKEDKVMSVKKAAHHYNISVSDVNWSFRRVSKHVEEREDGTGRRTTD